MLSLPGWKTSITEKGYSAISVGDHLYYNVARLCFWCKLNGKAWQDAVFGTPALFFPLWSLEKEGKREMEADKQREERRLPVDTEMRDWVKGVTAVSYQKNKENELSRKTDQWIRFMQKTANSRRTEILLWGEKWIIDAFFSFLNSDSDIFLTDGFTSGLEAH